jgi:hypothetical protein
MSSCVCVRVCVCVCVCVCSQTVTGLTALFAMNVFHSESDSYMYTSNTFLQLCFAGLAIYLLFGGLLAYYMKTGIVQFT